MKNSTPAEDPDSYVEALGGWQRDRVAASRQAVRSVPSLEEGIKWGPLVYSREGPALYIRAEAHRVLFGFWRGQQLDSWEPRLKATGKYDKATMEIREDTKISAAVVCRLAREAVALNLKLGDPRLEAKRSGGPKAGRMPRRVRGRSPSRHLGGRIPWSGVPAAEEGLPQLAGVETTP